MKHHFAPGNLVFARGREWVALPSTIPDTLRLRPLSGAERDIQVLHPEVELEPVSQARFDLPDADNIATQDSAHLLSQALRLSLRRSAGPFRSAARISFSPRAYQLVPLLMALRLPVIRLLIADDVGIGKTIEAGLILRELIDRGEIERFSILCPPHLIDQWTKELSTKFDLDTVAVTASSAPRLERRLPPSETLFDNHKLTVVSLDYIKTDRRRDSFKRACPSCIVVDEAHTCIGTHIGKQQRYTLLKSLAEDKERHMVFLTATPHSGDEEAFERLLGLLDDNFNNCALDEESSRKQLARHFVQRRRIDIISNKWDEKHTFPKHETTEHTYRLNEQHVKFQEAVLDYALDVVKGAGEDHRQRRLAFWSTLALMRCVGSSPAAALNALRNQMSVDHNQLESQIYDDDFEDSDTIDIEPASGFKFEDKPLTELVERAKLLTYNEDPKTEATIQVLKPLIEDGANPVIFCHYIATVGHVATKLREAFPNVLINEVTGALTPSERRVSVDSMQHSNQRILVATDCLSEGINLQTLFDVVIHYDLSWNPTRHQQREGRIDRFGQTAPIVRSILLFSEDSAIDGAVLKVILNKAKAIREATGVAVPLPDNRDAVTGALMNAVLFRKGTQGSLPLKLDLSTEKQIENIWRDSQEGERRSRARFAQNTIKPEEVLSVLKRWQQLLGDSESIERFVSRAMSRLNAPLESECKRKYKVLINSLPLSLRERLATRGLSGSPRISFTEPAPSGSLAITRNHPLPSILADSFLEATLEKLRSQIPSLGRCGAWRTNTVNTMTTIALLRIRHKLTIHAKQPRFLLAEEADAITFSLDPKKPSLFGLSAVELISHPATGDLEPSARMRLIEQGKHIIDNELTKAIEIYARRRAKKLEREHVSIRKASRGLLKVSVESVLPVDIIGFFVLIPERS